VLSLHVPAPLRLPAFRAWWLTTQGSNAGTWMQTVAAAWLMLEATDSAAMVGVLGLAQRGPALLLTPLAGRLADRRDRRHVLLVAFVLQLAGAAGLAVAAGLGAAGPEALIALSLLGGVGQTLAWPAQLVTVSSLVPREQLPAAVSLNSAGFNLARVVGPAIAGGLLVVGGATICFVINTISFLPQLRVVRRLPEASAGGRNAAATFHEAVRHALASPALVRLMTGCGVFAFCAAPLTVLMPVYADDLGASADGLGLLLGAFGLGAAVGSIAVMRIVHRVPRHRIIPAAMVGFAFLYGAVATSPTWWLALPACALAGACWLAVFTSTNASIQLLSPDAVRGRVLALYLWLLTGPMALSGVFVGWLAGEAGIRAAFIATAVPLLAYGILTFVRPVREIDAHSTVAT
jgi:MFS family permease